MPATQCRGGTHQSEYGIHETRRDQAVARALEAQGIECHSYLDQLLFQPGSILTQSGSYFQVFSQFRRICYNRLHMALPKQVAKPDKQSLLNIESDAIPESVSGFAVPSESLRALWPAGEDQAHQRLAQFADEQIHYYQTNATCPPNPAPASFRPTLQQVRSPRHACTQHCTATTASLKAAARGVFTWITELLWREFFYKHILVGYPRVSRHRAFRPETEYLPWRNAPDELSAWKQGRTGFPIIDAAIRQLLETG